MKKMNVLHLCIGVLVLFFMVSCSKDDTIETETIELEQTTTVDAKAAAPSYTITPAQQSTDLIGPEGADKFGAVRVENDPNYKFFQVRVLDAQNKPWISVLKVNNFSFRYTIDASLEAADRNAIVIIDFNNKDGQRIVSRSFVVRQEKSELAARCETGSPQKLIASFYGGTTRVLVTSNTSWRVTAAPWVNMSPTSGTGDGIITVSIAQNPENRPCHPRTAGMTIVANHDSSQKESISVYQFSKPLEPGHSCH
ncbi:BACON domain-containing protein [Aquimarina megaterium]|uniref:BACON domain-containing protein n=1 Tax=Aquimarina megaterium TaxID=1443666 RepID=UPI000943E18A|nr:BACON domain-containing protein [Aquimarina megaterium]